MKSLKVIYMGKPLKNIYPFATKFQVFKWKVARFMRKLILSLVAVNIASWILVGTFYAGSTLRPKTVYAEKEVQVTVATELPVMDRIIQCESNGHQFAPSGQLLIKVNTNGTTDVGIAQINSVWFSTATKMGYNLANEEDNKAFAKWLFINKGSNPWSSSAHCWNR